jgi:DNA-binding NarL/FixJ family response regulator
MDINMPRMNGIEATAHITKGYPDTIIIGFSVNGTTVNQEAMKRAGAVQLIPKDAAVEKLSDSIREAVTNRETPM